MLIENSLDLKGSDGLFDASALQFVVSKLKAQAHTTHYTHTNCAQAKSRPIPKDKHAAESYLKIRLQA